MQALGIRITSLGFYIKNVSEARRKEYDAQDLANKMTERMQQELRESVEEQKTTLQTQQADTLRAIQQQHQQEVRVLQQLMAARKGRLAHDQASTEPSSCNIVLSASLVVFDNTFLSHEANT